MASAGDCNFTQDDRVREAGETWLREVLVHGGARDPWDMRWDRVMDGDDELLRELGDSSRSLTGR